MLFLLHLIRAFENTLLDLKDENLVHGPVHISIGQEANAAAAAVVLQKSDLIGSTHRAHGHFLAKALMCYSPADFDPVANDITEDMQTAVNKTLAESWGSRAVGARDVGVRCICAILFPEIWAAMRSLAAASRLPRARLGRRNYRQDHAWWSVFLEMAHQSGLLPRGC